MCAVPMLVMMPYFGRAISQSGASSPALPMRSLAQRMARARGDARAGEAAAEFAGGQFGLVGGENSGYWLAPDGQNYEVITQLPRASRTVVDDIANLNISTSRLRPDGTVSVRASCTKARLLL